MRFASTAILCSFLGAATGVLGSLTTVTVTVTQPLTSRASTISRIKPSGEPHTASTSIPIIPGGPVSSVLSSIGASSGSSALATTLLPSASVPDTGIPPVSIPTSLFSSSASVIVPITTGASSSSSIESDTSGTSASVTAPTTSSTQPSSGTKTNIGLGGVALTVILMMAPAFI